MKIAIAQLNPTIGDLTGNAQKILAAAQQAAEQGARLLLTPELSLCGYPPRDLLIHPGFVASMATTLEQLAQDLPRSLIVLVGTVEVNPKALLQGGKPLFNSMALLKNGKIQKIFHKRLLPTYDVFDEDRYFEPGKEANHFVLELEEEQLAVNSQRSAVSGQASEATPNSTLSSPPHPFTPSLRIGVTICEDLWNDEEFWGKRSYTVNPIADLAQEGVDLTINLSASPYTVGKQRVREAMLKHSATRFHQPVIYANQVGGNDDLLFDGCSVAFNRQGELVCRARTFETDLLLLEFHDGDLQPSSIAVPPESEEAELWGALVLGVRDYAQKCGFSKAIIGLSGGIDSALVAAIATAALGSDNVLGVLMPSTYSSDHSIKDALALAENLGIHTETLPIGDLMQAYDHTFAHLFAGTEFGLAEENIQSRIRGNLLMAISNKFGHLLLSTGNKSEMAVGYCTLYGDMNGGLAAIADVPKTRVYSLCRWLNERLTAKDERLNLNPDLSFSLHPLALPELIPPNILTKPPSAELKPGQVDQDSLPDYDTLDAILARLINGHQTPDEIVAAGYAPQIVNKIVKLVTRAEFKRRQAPPVLKVTDRAFGTGWRMPIASRWLPSTSSEPV
ncbi:NAD+ synthase [Stenomitos frigidus]|uniref:Glutamine-dependent NAD(+) synthetase n=1 Tax=Stenomitos frigidus ULC18 TaxID=2107698 RepID=A0A2T1EER1_9CYAN|nr:NAD+ synthase [Stenomitos frigidus]PSB31230.1 NAD+ synthase [Stenomitos frigidus ULC18]